MATVQQVPFIPQLGGRSTKYPQTEKNVIFDPFHSRARRLHPSRDAAGLEMKINLQQLFVLQYGNWPLFIHAVCPDMYKRFYRGQRVLCAINRLGHSILRLMAWKNTWKFVHSQIMSLTDPLHHMHMHSITVIASCQGNDFIKAKSSVLHYPSFRIFQCTLMEETGNYSSVSPLLCKQLIFSYAQTQHMMMV